MASALRSMTGFGSACRERDGARATVDLKSVNQKGLRLNVRSRPRLGTLEKKLRDRIGAALARGSVDATVELVRTAIDPGTLVNHDLAESGVAALRNLCERHGLAREVTLDELLLVPGVFDTRESETLEDGEGELILDALDEALEQVQAMRAEEGAALGRALGEHLDALEAFRRAAAERAPEVVEAVRARLVERLEELRGQVRDAIDQHVIEREVLVFADRADITEEIDRLASHIAQFRESLRAGGEIGRKLDFLAQEMLREVNTIGSKGNDTAIASATVGAKLAIEKIKEQAANLE
jgi:uncharacterized protein (TIGR00255 family)